MNKFIKRFKSLQSNIQFDNYLICSDNIDHIINRSSFDKHLIKFIYKCYKYNIKIYYKNNHKFYFLNKDDVINQIHLLKKIYIKQHIDNLVKFSTDNVNFNTQDYVSFNIDATNNNKIPLHTLDKLNDLTNVIYHFKLLESNNPTDFNIDYTAKYHNLVDLNNISKYNLSDLHAKNGVFIIDQYSS